jgi:hypothetical protein
VLEVSQEGRELPVGVCRANASRASASPELVEDLMLARLKAELQSKNPIRASELEVETDWKLFAAARSANRAALTLSNH